MNEPAPRRQAGVLQPARDSYHKGDYPEAERQLSRALAGGTGDAAAYLLLADIRRRLGQPAREAQALEQALAAGARATFDHPEAVWIRLGAVRASQGDTASAIAAYEQAAVMAPDNFAAAYGIAASRLQNKDFEAARQSVEDLERRFPNVAGTHLIAGHLHKAFGNAAEAARAYRQALELEPGLGEALYNLVDLDPPEPDDVTTTLALEIATREDARPADRINAGFALARIHDRAGRYAQAFEHVRDANRLARDDLNARQIRYRPQETEERAARIIAEYPASTFRKTLEPLPIDLTPIFIVGLPRSGTTLIEQILASNGTVQAAGERNFAVRREAEFRESRRSAGRAGPVEPANDTDAELLKTAREKYVEDLFESGLDGPRVVDKLPANFEIAGFLRSMFPQAPIIHSRRDPRATCFSLYWANFAAHEPWYHDLRDLAHYCRQYQRLMAHWRDVIPEPCVEVVYEELVRDSEARIADLLHSTGLEFDAACIRFHEHDRPILTASHAQVRSPMNTDSIDRWRRYAEWLGPLRDL